MPEPRVETSLPHSGLIARSLALLLLDCFSGAAEDLFLKQPFIPAWTALQAALEESACVAPEAAGNRAQSVHCALLLASPSQPPIAGMGTGRDAFTLLGLPHL